MAEFFRAPVLATDVVVSSGAAGYVLLTFRSPVAGEIGTVGTPVLPSVTVAVLPAMLPGMIKLLQDAQNATALLGEG